MRSYVSYKKGGRCGFSMDFFKFLSMGVKSGEIKRLYLDRKRAAEITELYTNGFITVLSSKLRSAIMIFVS